MGEESLSAVPKNKQEYESSPFRDALDRALTAIDDISSASYNCVKKADDMPESGGFGHPETILSLKTDDFSNGIINNIIAFLGDRGSGKTSCMDTIRHGLSSDVYGWRPPKSSLLFLDAIDPSFFDNHHNILEIVIGELYREFKKIKFDWKTLNSNKRSELNQIQNTFGMVKRALRFMESDVKFDMYEEHEELTALSEVQNLKHIIRQLITEYLDYHDKNILVISIDDIDINVREAFVMMEQIRKYLILPRVIILMGAKLNQLNQAVSLYYHKEVLPSRHSDNGDTIIPDVAAIAERYIDKFLPLSHRIFMPEIDVIANTDLTIVDKTGNEENFASVEFGILSLIYSRCGYLFYNYEDGPSLIIPRNLRELRLLTALLYEMEDRDESMGDLNPHEKNKQAFKNYFYSTWLSDLPYNLQVLANSIRNERILWQLNKSVITLLDKESKLTESLKAERADGGVSSSEMIIRKRIMEICNPETVAMNISIGDVMFIIERISERLYSSDFRRFLFFITTHYSILLYELYDRLTDSLTHPAVIEGNQIPRLRHNYKDEIEDYFKVVGNNFFVLTGTKFIPLTSTSNPREAVMINGKVLTKEIEKLISAIENNIDNITEDENPTILNLIEFFILTISRRVSTKSGDYSLSDTDSWRTDSTISYLQPFPVGVKNLLFEATAPFVNILRMEWAYNRFDKDFYRVAKKCKGSLVNKLLNHRRNRNSDEYHDLLSQMAIRNMEVLSDLQWWMEERKKQLRPDGKGQLGVLANFYLNFGANKEKSYNVDTYYEDEDASKNTPNRLFHKISFRPLALLGECLDRVSRDEQASRLFLSIYSPTDRFEFEELYTPEEIEHVFRYNELDDYITAMKKLKTLDMTKSSIGTGEILKGLIDTDLFDFNHFYRLFDRLTCNSYYSDLQKNIAHIENDIANLHGEQSLIKEEIDIVSEEVKSLKSELSDCEKRHTNLLNDETKHIKELKTAVSGTDVYFMIKNRIDSGNEQIKKQEKEIPRIRENIDDLNHRRSYLRSVKVGFDKDILKKKTQLKAQQEKSKQVYPLIRRSRQSSTTD